MDYIRGMNFAPFHRKGTLEQQETLESFDYMVEKLHTNFIILSPSGLQDTAQSEEICYTSSATFSDEELRKMIRYAKGKGMKVALKPTANCKNGVWRAYISFFEQDVVCEPKWSNWFASYKAFQLHYAKIAEEEQCEMFIAGCEMVMSEHREKEWRDVIKAIKEVYHGLVSYNTDKYQEDHVTWWDCVDVISSSGYYPIDDMERQLDRIEAVVKKFKKPFFFAEAGCMARAGSKQVPNNWELQGELRLEEQVEWYEAFFHACEKRDWVEGFAFWDWSSKMPTQKEALKDSGYNVCKKPVEKTIGDFYAIKEEGL